MREYVSFQYLIIYIGLQILSQFSYQLRLWFIFSSMHEWDSREKLAGSQWNRLIDAVVTIFKYKKITIYHDIYIKIFYDATVSYLKVSTHDVLNSNNSNKKFTELTRVFE